MSKHGYYILEITVFVCGALVMIFEITGSRILAPHIGTSTYTWTSLIGVILASLSIGYWLGGKLADRKPNIAILAFAIFVSGGLVSVTILFKDSVLIVLGASFLSLEIKAVIAAVLLFGPASVFLGVVTPYAVKLKTKSLEETGKTVGNLYAISTIGSIVGTFAAGFLIIPFVGSNRTLYIIAGSLFLLAVVLAPFSVSRANIGFLVLFVVGITATEIQTVYLRRSIGFYDFDTEYSRVHIFETKHKTDQRAIRAMKIDPVYFQSSMYLDSDELTSEYAKYYHLIKYFRPGFTRTLMIGGAGYSFPKDYLKAYPEAEIEVVEIDPRMTSLAHRFFRLKENPRLKVIHEDGRVFLNRSEKEKYDAVLMDAFSTLFTVPFQLTTVEAVRHIDRVLKNEGVVIFNLGAVLEGEGSGFLRAELETYRAVFPNVYLFKVDPAAKDSAVQNIIIVADKSLRKNSFRSSDPRFSSLIANRYIKAVSGDAPVLTDDLAPVERYNSFIHSR